MGWWVGEWVFSPPSPSNCCNPLSQITRGMTAGDQPSVLSYQSNLGAFFLHLLHFYFTFNFAWEFGSLRIWDGG